jgi:putative SOS response-associated peptidase YedK
MLEARPEANGQPWWRLRAWSLTVKPAQEPGRLRLLSPAAALQRATIACSLSIQGQSYGMRSGSVCGRFALSITPAQFQRVFGCAPPELPARYNIAPDSPIIVVRRRADGSREAVCMHWGLLPPWSTNAADPARQINARIETAAEKPMFRAAFRRGRCLVPADGFYEWQKRGSGPSQPFFVRRLDGAPMAFAAISRRSRLADGSELDTCAILTTDALPSIRDIHPRMPVLVAPEHFDAWLDPGLQDPALLRALLTPPEAHEIGALAVSRRVNDPRNDGPELLEPVAVSAAEDRRTTRPLAQESLF